MTYKLFTDGGARGNPGPSGIGAAIFDNENEIYALSKYIGEKTNNEAEYMGVIEGLEACIEKKIKTVDVYIDSELVQKQLNGDYKVKNERLLVFHTKIKELENKFTKVTYTHVKREKNKRADALVNAALDSNGF